MFCLKTSVSVLRIDNGDNGGASIYKVSSSGIKAKTCVPQIKTMSILDYTDLENATAPPAPWYFYDYPTEVITKAETIKYWKRYPVDKQKFFLDIYLNHYTNGIF